MQNSLDAVDWQQLTSFGTSQALMDWMYEEDGELTTLTNPSMSDSMRLYSEVAEILEHLHKHVDPTTLENLKQSIGQLISLGAHPDEFDTGAASDGCYWISMSPETVRGIQRHWDAVDTKSLVAVLEAHPPRLIDEGWGAFPGYFVDFLEQYKVVIDLAVDNGYGLLGHCG